MKPHQVNPFDVKLMNAGTLLLVVGFCALVAWTAMSWTLRHSIFAIGSILVQGDTTHNNELTLRANVASSLKGNFFTLDLAQAKAAFESVPWVRKAVIQREFPNRLRVILQEHQSAGLWGTDSESKLINTFGEVFEANTGDAETDDLPHLNGPTSQASQVLSLYRMLASEFLTVDTMVELLELSGRGGWRLQLDGGAEIELGRGSMEEVRARAKRFISTFTQVTSQYNRPGIDAVESADLRHSDGYAIKLRGVTTLIGDKSPQLKQLQ
jgi:cell division protein FtsQ